MDPLITEIDRSIEAISESRDSHQAWLDHWSSGCNCEKNYLETVGSADDQRRHIIKYNKVIEVLTAAKDRLMLE